MIKLLHIDDDPSDLELTRLNLSRISTELDIRSVTSPDEVLRMIEEEKFDCILSDYQMPAKSGLDLLNEIRQKNITIPVIFLTGQGNEKVAAQALRAGADDYYTKSYGLAQFERIYNSIKNAVDSRQFIIKRERIEQDLHENKVFLSHIISHIQQVVFFKGTQGRYRMMNGQFGRMIGRDEKDMLGKSDYDLFPKEIAEKLILNDHQVMASRQSAEYEEILSFDQGTRKFRTTKIPVFGRDGEISGILGIATEVDATEMVS